MLLRIFWIGGTTSDSLAIVGRPQADRLVDEIAAWCAAGIRVVVSLLERAEADELGLRDEAAACTRAGIVFISFPISDRGVPGSLAEAFALCDVIAARLGQGARVGIHCRSGIGRSALIAACVLVRFGHRAEAALEKIAAARGTRVPDTQAQAAWVVQFQEHASAH